MAGAGGGRRSRPTAFRRVFHAVQRRLYAGGWPARLSHRLRLQGALGTERHEIDLGAGAGALPPLRVAFASDFHAGPTTHEALIDDTCRAVASARPDLLLLGGDFVSLSAWEAEGLAARLGEIPAPLGRFAVLGNHDVWAGPRRIASRLERAGIRVLVNANARLPAPFDRVWVCGLDDPDAGRPDPVAAFDGADGVRLVLMHSPEGLRHIGRIRFDLAFCGHTHGGQIALPGGRPLVLPAGAYCRRYPHRLFHPRGAGGGVLVVTRGIGCSDLPVRLFADSEVVLCTLVPGTAGPGGTGSAGRPPRLPPVV